MSEGPIDPVPPSNDPDSDRKVAAITTFEHHGPCVSNPLPAREDEDGNIVDPAHSDNCEEGCEWYWHTQSPNGQVVGDSGEGYRELRKAVQGFFAQQGVDPKKATTGSPYSQLKQINKNTYQIIKYEEPEE